MKRTRGRCRGRSAAGGRPTPRPPGPPAVRPQGPGSGRARATAGAPGGAGYAPTRPCGAAGRRSAGWRAGAGVPPTRRAGPLRPGRLRGRRRPGRRTSPVRRRRRRGGRSFPLAARLPAGCPRSTVRARSPRTSLHSTTRCDASNAMRCVKRGAEKGHVNWRLPRFLDAFPLHGKFEASCPSERASRLSGSAEIHGLPGMGRVRPKRFQGFPGDIRCAVLSRSRRLRGR